MGIGSWAGLWFALGIPIIIIMYLFKRKFIDTPVSSHLLWRRALENTEANRPWQKLRSRLLMWLQLLAAALLAFALMRPFLWTEAGSGGHTIVVADVSASMNARYPAGPGGDLPEASAAATRLEEMKRSILADTRQSGSGLTLIRMGGSPQVVESGASDRTSWERAVESLSADYGRTAYREAISLASAVAEGQEDARIVVYTDAQWNERTDDLPVSAPIEVRRIDGAGYRNAAVEQFGTDGSGRFVGVIANTGSAALELRAELSGDGLRLAEESLKLAPGQRKTVTFGAAETADVYRLGLADAPDDYAADDDAFAFAETGGTVKVLLLSDGNLFLEKALRLSGAEVTRLDLSGGVPTAQGAESTSGNSGTANGKDAETTEKAAPPLPEIRPDLVVVEGQLPSALQSGEWKRLLAGAAVWTIGGGTDTQQPAGRRVEVSAHPVTRYLTLSEPYFGPLTRDKPTGLTPIMKIGERPAIAAGMENGRRALWFGFDLQSGDLPLNSEFPVLVSNAVTWLSGGRGGGLGRVVSGAAVDVPIVPGAEDAVWRPLQGLAFAAGAKTIEAEKGVKDAGGSTESEAGSNEQPDVSEPAGNAAESSPLPSSSQPAPPIPGLYAFEQTGRGLGGAPVYLLDVRPDASESAAPVGEDPIFGGAAVDPDGAAPDRAASGDNRGRFALTALLAALIAAIMLTEWGVYRRGRSI
ncbi:vWA domain-containing protein [Saccharibacillus qingshengii]|uniref:vWA domain-containing protein n=1 Tax=Saccharibacillus qingshengii TaxID=1763540 RepID=UPI00155338D9|nr:VWA domain-containing protein [Saccharibacillus qingshengii]